MGKIETNPASLATGQPGKIVALSLLLSLGVPGQNTAAQVVPTETGTSTTVETVGDRIDISDGQLSNNSANLFHSFEQFDLNSGQTANFLTPDSVTNVIGKIDAARASTINGTLQVSGSDANLYLMNPAGMLLGPDIQLNLSGGFTATTATGLEFDHGQFETTYDGNYQHLTDNPTGFQFDSAQPAAVVNLGELTVETGQSINLIGGTVVNAGEITAPEGVITVAAVEGESTVRISQENQLLSLEVAANNNNSYSAISPNSIGEMLTGGELTNATTLTTRADGSVQLENLNNTLSNTTVINETGGSTVISGTLSTSGEVGGNVNVLGEQVTLFDAQLDASGESSGGLIRVGGDYRGNDDILSATHTVVDEFSSLVVNALESGNGGRAIVWANESTAFHGTLFGQGGRQSGNGGFGEVSGKENLVFTGIADLSAPNGAWGELLLDPENIFITDGGTNYSDGDNDYISSTNLADQRANITLEANNNITIEDLSSSFSPSSNTLRLHPGVSITLTADADRNGVGQFTMDPGDTIRTEQGDINITGAGITVGTLNTSTNEPNGNGIRAGGDVSLISTQGVTANRIWTSGFLPVPEYEAGDVNVRAEAGDINISRSIKTSSTVIGDQSGSGGDIALRASGSIRVGPENIPFMSTLSSRSWASGRNAGLGGDISLIAETGEIAIAGNINTQSSAGNSNSQASGDVTLISNNISTEDINTQSRAGNSNSEEGGEVTLAEYTSGSNSTITIDGEINTSSVSTDSNASNGGAISITANTVAVNNVSSISSSDQNTEEGGDITINARNSLNITNDVLAYSQASDGNNAGNGGSVDLTTNSLSVGSIETWSQAQNFSGRGGDITILADTVDISRILSNTIATSDAKDAGAVSITAENRLSVGEIAADSIGGGNSAAIELTGNEIDLTMSDSITGESIWFRSASANQAINLGNDSDTAALDLTAADMDAVGNGVSLIRVSRPDSTSSISLFSSVLDSVGSRPPIEIVGGEDLTSPDSDLILEITAPNTGYVVDKEISFSNITNLIVTNPVEPEIVEPEPEISEPEPEPVISEPVISEPEPEPVISEPEPVIVEPEPEISEPEPVIAEPEPVISEPEPEISEPEPVISEPEPEISEPEPVISAPEPEIFEPEPTEPKASEPEPVTSERVTSGSNNTENETSAPVISEGKILDSENLDSQPLYIESVDVVSREVTLPVEQEISQIQTPSAQSPLQSLINSIQRNEPSYPNDTSATTVIYTAAEPVETEDINRVLSQLEREGSQSFNDYLGIAAGDRTAPVTTVHRMQETLTEVEQNTGVRPALIYVYYVPDAASEKAVASASDRVVQPDDQLEVMVITPSGEPIRHRRWGVTREQVDVASQTLRYQATSQFSTDRQYLPPAQQLYEWIMDPIDTLLETEDIGSLGFVMDDGLRTLPLATLHNGDSYLIEQYSLGILPTFSLTDFETAHHHRPKLKDTEVLAMGASRFENQPPLPAAEQEINLITQTRWEGDRFLNEDFVLDNLETQLQAKDYGIIHLATHAVFEAGDLDNSYIQLWDEQFSLSDISELNLDEADIALMVLSACNTALGDPASEYGFAGFTVTSGAESALASLWPVSDEGTLGFMSQFYQHLQTSTVRADALRQAQLDLIRGEVGIADGQIYGPTEAVQPYVPELAESGRWDFSHPFYWSPFTMIGNPW